MKTATVEVFADARTISLPTKTLSATSLGTIANRALRSAKLKRGVRIVTVRMTVLVRPSAKHQDVSPE